MVSVSLIDKSKQIAAVLTWQIIYALAFDINVCKAIKMKGKQEKESL